MKSYLRHHRALEKPRGAALAVAMLVIVMLTAIGALALNAASYDMASAGVVGEIHLANNIAGGGMALGRCKMCESIDGIILAMQSMRSAAGKAPEFVMDREVLEAQLEGGELAFEPPDATNGRGSFGNIVDGVRAAQPPEIEVTLDRPRESGEISGFSIRESSGSDTASFCFRTYRVTSDGTFVPPGATTPGTKATHRAYIVTGPLPCSS